MFTHRGAVSSVPRGDCSVTFPLTFRALLQCGPLQSFSKTSNFSNLCLEELCPLKWILGEEDKGIGVCCPREGTQWYVGFSSVGHLLLEACYQVTYNSPSSPIPQSAAYGQESQYYLRIVSLPQSHRCRAGPACYLYLALYEEGIRKCHPTKTKLAVERAQW